MLSRKPSACCCIALLCIWLGSIETVVRAQAAGAKTGLLIFQHAVDLPGVSLDAGTYIFELVDMGNAWPIVRVSSADRRTFYYAGFTQPVQRHGGTSRELPISFSETSTTGNVRITVWWPRDEPSGYEFIWL